MRFGLRLLLRLASYLIRMEIGLPRPVILLGALQARPCLQMADVPFLGSHFKCHETRRLDGPTMAAAGTAAAAGEALDGAAERGPPANSERHFVDPSHWRAVGRPAAALRPDGHGVEPVRPLAQGRDLAAHPVRPAS